METPRKKPRYIVAVTQAAESGEKMKALALLGVFFIAKLAVLAGRPIQLSAWGLIAYFWQDVLVALLFGLLDLAIRRPWIGWMLYGAAVLYVAINVPIARVLSSPLTWPMIGAAGGTLSDSIKYHATPGNIALMLLVVVVAVALVWLLHRFKVRSRPAIIIAALVVVLSGPFASSRVETIGLDRNPVMALVTTAMPRLSASVAGVEIEKDWRASPLPGPPIGEDLSGWRASAAGRNVVLIVLESAGARYLRPYGARQDPMPNLSELSETALIFEDAYAVYPESIKALFSTLCSRYPAMDTKTESYAGITTESLSSVLNNAGYRTALFHSGRFMYLGMEAVVENRGYEVLEDAGAIGGNHESSFGVDEPSTVNRALAWIDSLDRGERFFLTYLPIAGHHPYETPEPGPFPEQEETDRYLNALYYSDASLGLLLGGLRERGLDQKTLFIIFGDHGQAFGQHEGNYGHSLFLYEENIRVPYLVASPGLITEQARITKTISLIDTAPTILDLLGLPQPADYQGSSALGRKPAMALFYTDYSLGLMGLRDGCWKFIDEIESGRAKLFDLCRDAAEMNDLSDLYAERVTAYRGLLRRWAAAQKALILDQTD
jgi:glucan phosphoethanolaminetransferase (alkaline phosphatase superfamily)